MNTAKTLICAAIAALLAWPVVGFAKSEPPETCEAELAARSEDERLEKALSAVAKEREKGEQASPLRYLKLIETHGLTSARSQFTLAEAFLEAGWLYTAVDGKVTMAGYKSGTEEGRSKADQSLERLSEMVRAWPEELRYKFAVDFVESAKPHKLVFMDNVVRRFNVDDPGYAAQVHNGVLKTYLKRWGDKRRFQDLKPLFLQAELSSDKWDLIRWSLDYPLLHKHVTYAEFSRSLQEFAGANALELRPFLDDPAVKRKILMQYGTEVIVGDLRVADFYELPLRAADAHPNQPTLIGAIEDFMKIHPGVIPSSLIHTLAEGTGDRDTFVFLLNTSLHELDQIDVRPNMDFFDLLTMIYPWPKEQIERWNKQGRRDVLAMAAEIFDITGKDLFMYMTLDPNDFPSAVDLSDLMEMIRNNYQLAGNEENLRVTKRNPEPKAELLRSVIKELTTEEGQSVSVSGHNIRALISSGREKFTERIRAELSVPGSDIEFTYEDLMQLTEEWSDIEPIMTLFARLTQPEVRAVVLRIFKESLNGTFKDYKFFSEDAAPQVGFLNDQQLKAWTRARLRLSIPGLEAKEAAPVAADNDVEVNEMINDEVMPYILKTPLAAMIENAGPLEDHVKALLAEAGRGNPNEVLGRYRGAGGETGEWLAARLAATLKNPEADRSDRRNSARLLIVLFNTELSAQVEDVKEELIPALKNVERAIPKGGNIAELENKGMILSVVDHSPRLLLTVGDLVQTNSCQNYKTGGMIRSLPGYVIDGNVQVMASFHVEGKHFQSVQDYRAVLQALTSDQMAQVRFNGNKRIVEFELRSGQKIQTQYLGYAYLRQMLKLGATKGGHQPSLRLEREYLQNNEHMEVMQRQHKALLRDLVKEMKAVQNQPMAVPKTRNPGGVYSDLATSSGIKTEAYEFGPATE